jgi:hypothetical protein
LPHLSLTRSVRRNDLPILSRLLDRSKHDSPTRKPTPRVENTTPKIENKPIGRSPMLKPGETVAASLRHSCAIPEKRVRSITKLAIGDSCRSCQAPTSRLNRVCFLNLSEKGVSRLRVTGVRTVATEAQERRFGVSEPQRDKFGVSQKTKRRRRRFFRRLTRK